MPNKAELREKWNKAGKDVVVLHMFKRSYVCPNPSPFPLKFETYLRIAGIEYITDFSQPKSTKNKSPWMTFNGQDMADSQLCMEHLAKTLDKDLSAHLSAEEKAIARGLRAILEDHFYFCFMQQRYIYEDLDRLNGIFDGGLPGPKWVQKMLGKYFRGVILDTTRAQGMGRHTKDEVIAMGIADLKSISDFLAEKSFIMGEKPTEVDCIVFGFMCQILYTCPPESPYLQAINKDMTNLKNHADRMRQQFWPDWDECLCTKA